MTEVLKEEFSTALGLVEKWILRSTSVSVEIISLGCVIKSIRTADRSGQSADIVLGFDDIEGKLYNSMHGNKRWEAFGYCERQVFSTDVLIETAVMVI